MIFIDIHMSRNKMILATYPPVMAPNRKTSLGWPTSKQTSFDLQNC